MSLRTRCGERPGSMASCSDWASRSPSLRFRSTWCPGGIGHRRAGRRSFAITPRGLHRLICLWSRRSPSNSSTHFLFLATDDDGCCGPR